MSEGRVLHLRCFLEGIEVPISSCAVTGQVGSAATAHIELLDAEHIFKILPRTMVHIFFYDHMNGTNPNPPVYELGSMSNAGSYKLLFFGEVFSVYHNKSGFGSRTVTLMALDFSNILDTNYIHQVSYVNTEGIIGIGDQGAASFTAGQSIGNNPFDDIINSPTMVIQHLATQRALSPTHAKRQSKIGGLFAIFELLLGVDRHAMGMNSWLTLHERRVRFLDMIDSDDGITAAKLFGDAVFEEWLQGSLGTQSPSMSFRQISHILFDYIYYRMCPIPTAAYHKPSATSLGANGTSLTGREAPEITTQATESTLDPTVRDYFSSNAWNTSGNINPELATLAVNVVKNLRDGLQGRKKYPGTIITSGFRTPKNNASSSSTSLHLRGLAVDIDSGVWPDPLPHMSGYTYDSLFVSTAGGSANGSGSNNVSFTATQNLGSLGITEDNIKTLIELGYLNASSTVDNAKATDGRILRFFLNRPSGIRTVIDFNSLTGIQALWLTVAEAFEKALFGGVIYNFQQFICYLMVYPLMPYAADKRVDLDVWLPRFETKGYDGYINYWSGLLNDKNALAREVFQSNSTSALMHCMSPDDMAIRFLEKLFKKYEPYFKNNIFVSGSPINSQDGTITTLYRYFAYKSLSQTVYLKRSIIDNSPQVGEYRADGQSGILKGSGNLIYANVDDNHYNLFFTQNDNVGYTSTQVTSATATHPTVFSIRNVLGFLNFNDAENFAQLVCTFYEKKTKFWSDLSTAVAEEATLLGLQSRITKGVDTRVVNHKYNKITHWVGSPIYPALGITGDDPVHIQMNAIGSAGSSSDQGAGIAQSETDADTLYRNRERMVAFLATPDIWMCAPPKCNVIFPEEVVSLNVSREMMRQTTRVMLMTYDQLLADNVILNAHYFAPQFQDTDNIEQIAFATSTANEVVYPHEKFSGIIPKVQRRSELSFYSRASNAEESDTELTEQQANELQGQSYETQYAVLSQMATAGIADKIRAYGSNVAHFELLKQRYSSTRISVTCKFLPRLVPSLPAVVIGKQVAGRDFIDTHTWLGMLESVQHSYSQAGATTSITLSTCRPYDTGEGSVDELAALKVSGNNLFKNQDPDTLFEATLGDSANSTPLLSYHLPDIYLPKTLLGRDAVGHRMDSLPSRILEVTNTSDIDNNILFMVPNLTTSTSNSAKYKIKDFVLSSLEYFEKYAITASKVTDRSTPIFFTEQREFEDVEDGIKVVYSTPTTTIEEAFERTTRFSASGTVSGSDLDYSIISEYRFNSDTTTRTAAVQSAEVTVNMRPALERVLAANGYSRDAIGTSSQATTENTVNIANEIASDLTQVVAGSRDFLVERGGKLNTITRVSTYPVTAPKLGYLTLAGTWNITEERSTRERDFSSLNSMAVQATDTLITSSTFVFDENKPAKELFAKVTSTYNPATDTHTFVMRIPVLFYSTQFSLQLSEAAVSNNSGQENKLLPLEEALMPPWIDDFYKNGIVNSTTKTVNGTGIGRLYNLWFGCGSILDDVKYDNKSIYYTVTIEESVKKIISAYGSGKQEPLYSWANRNIATLADVLTPADVSERKSKDVFQTGGFHSMAVGDYNNLEGLGLVGQQLRSNVIATTTIVIPDSAAALDPRAERRKRVKLYRDYIVLTRGKLG